MRSFTALALCVLMAASALSGCAESERIVSSTETDIVQAVSETDSTAPVVSDTITTEATAPLDTVEDTLAAEELLRIRYNAVRPAVCRDGYDYYSSMENNQPVSGAAEIPESLIKAVCRAIDEDKLNAFIDEHGTGKPVSTDELCRQTDYCADYIFEAQSITADIDNDGTDDIISCVWGGGSGGFSDLILFRGGDSGFAQSASVCTLYYNIYAVDWKNEPYLFQEHYDYNTKQLIGCDIYAFRSGRLAAVKTICREITGYTAETRYEDSSYGAIDTIKATLSNSDMPSVLENNDGVIIGNAETVSEQPGSFTADLDNDGTPEVYTKAMFYPSNMGSVQGCSWCIDGVDAADDPIAILSQREVNRQAGQLYTFWLDEVDEENILYMYYTGSYGFELCAYRLNG